MVRASPRAARVVTASGVAQALDEIARETFEVALLDVNLGAETSFPIAEALKAKGVPFLFANGYGEQLKLADSVEAGVIQKPYTSGSIAWALESLLAK